MSQARPYRVPIGDDDEEAVAYAVVYRFAPYLNPPSYNTESRELCVPMALADMIAGFFDYKRKEASGTRRLTEREKVRRRAAGKLWVRLRWLQSPVERRTPLMPYPAPNPTP